MRPPRARFWFLRLEMSRSSSKWPRTIEEKWFLLWRSCSWE